MPQPRNTMRATVAAHFKLHCHESEGMVSHWAMVRADSHVSTSLQELVLNVASKLLDNHQKRHHHHEKNSAGNLKQKTSHKTQNLSRSRRVIPESPAARGPRIHCLDSAQDGNCRGRRFSTLGCRNETPAPKREQQKLVHWKRSPTSVKLSHGGTTAPP